LIWGLPACKPSPGRSTAQGKPCVRRLYFAQDGKEGKCNYAATLLSPCDSCLEDGVDGVILS
jgi:hypothetical protein